MPAQLDLPQPLWLWLLVACLATYRITSIINREKIFWWLRSLLGFKQYTDSEDYPDTFLANLVGCFYCLSVWVAIGVCVVGYFIPYLLLPFALSAVAVILLEKVA